jgi:hypothetical protein
VTYRGPTRCHLRQETQTRLREGAGDLDRSGFRSALGVFRGVHQVRILLDAHALLPIQPQRSWLPPIAENLVPENQSRGCLLKKGVNVLQRCRRWNVAPGRDHEIPRWRRHGK